MSSLSQDQQFKKILIRRNRIAVIGQIAFYFSLAVAFIALGFLVYTIVREAFGVVAQNYTTKPDLLAQRWLDEDKPFEELTKNELAEIATAPFANDKPRMRVLILENLLAVDTSNTVLFREVASQPVSELFEEGHYPSELGEKAIGNPPLEAIQYAEIMELNMSREELQDFVMQHVAGRRISRSWPLNDVLLNYGSIQATVDDANASAQRIDNIRDEIALAAASEEALSDASDAEVVALAKETALAAEKLAEEIQVVSEMANYNPLNEQANLASAAARAARDSANLAQELAEAGDAAGAKAAADEVAEKTRELLEISANAIIITRANPLVDAELKFRSWVSWDFLTQPMNRVPELTGIRTALLGSLWMIGITILIAFPLGVGAAIYLEEYAQDNFVNRLIQTNITNLAGVPSIIYGILGLAIFVRILEQFTSGTFFGYGDSTTANGRTIISGALTMSLLILPIIIINGQEAIRSVPNSLRQASYGLGATQWQTIWNHVLPNALPGILTGTILAVSRAIGETAPLIVVGAATYIVRNPATPFDKFTVIPIQIYRWTSEPSDQFRDAAAAAIVVLLVILLSLNSFAIILRNRFSRR